MLAVVQLIDIFFDFRDQLIWENKNLEHSGRRSLSGPNNWNIPVGDLSGPNNLNIPVGDLSGPNNWNIPVGDLSGPNNWKTVS